MRRMPVYLILATLLVAISAAPVARRANPKPFGMFYENGQTLCRADMLVHQWADCRRCRRHLPSAGGLWLELSPSSSALRSFASTWRSGCA